MLLSGDRVGDCRCVSQQATHLHISYDMCATIVEGRYFQVSEDTALASRGERPKAQAAQPPRGRSQRESSVAYIYHSQPERAVFSQSRSDHTGFRTREGR